MTAPDPNVLNSSTVLLNLASGLFGVLSGSLISWLLQRDTKAWTLRAELKRYRVSRITASVQSLRSCFFRAKVNMEFHHADLAEEEEMRQRPFALVELARNLLGDQVVPERVLEEVHRLAQNREQRRQIYNQTQSAIQAEALSSAAVLAACGLPPLTLASMQREILVLTDGRTSDATSVQARIRLYEQHQPTVLELMNSAEQFAQSLIDA